jgi:hypothetical protein
MRGSIEVLGLLAGMTLSLGAAPAPSVPAPGAAVMTMDLGGRKVALTHAAAFKAGSFIYLLITDQVLPPDEVKSEFELVKYRFEHKVMGLQVMLDSEHKVTETSYLWEHGENTCEGCYEISVSGGADGPLVGTVKTTAKGTQAEKLKVDGAFSAPFVKPSARR